MSKDTYRHIAAADAQAAFVPLSDELLYEHPERLPSRLVPYEVGMLLEPQKGSVPFFPADPPQDNTANEKRVLTPFGVDHED